MRLLFALILAWCLVLTSDAAAQEDEAETPTEEVAADPTDEQARQAYEAGAVAFDSGRYSVALDFFQRSYELSSRPELQYNIGLCLDRLRRDEEALAAFERYLEAEPESPHRHQVDARISSLRAAIAERERQREEREEELLSSDEEEEGSVLEKWWFWTLVGVLVAGGAATAVIVATSGGTEEPLPGTQGAIFTTLTWGP